MVSGLNHLTIAVSNLETSFEFYKNVLGLTPIMKNPEGAYFLAGDFWFCLEASPEFRPLLPPYDSHFAFSVAKPAFDQVQNKILASGVRLWKENRSEGESLYFLDPDLHKLEIHCGDWRTRLQHYSTRPEVSSFILHSRYKVTSTLRRPPSVSLIPFHADFLDAFLEWRRQPSSKAHNPLVEDTRENTLIYLQNDGADLNEFNVRNRFRWFIEYEGKPVGNVSVRNINRMMMFAEIAYGVSETYHGHGIATEAVRKMINDIFRYTPLRKLIAYVHSENIPSLRLLDRLGFKQEGLLRSHYIINNKPCNEAFLGLLKEEWPS